MTGRLLLLSIRSVRRRFEPHLAAPLSNGDWLVGAGAACGSLAVQPGQFRRAQRCERSDLDMRVGPAYTHCVPQEMTEVLWA